MNKQLAIAYAIAGLAVAAALIAIVGSTTGMFSSPTAAATTAAPPVLVDPTPVLPVQQPAPLIAPPSVAQPEVVYVDAPVRARHDDHDEDYKEEHEGRHRRENDDD